MNRFVGLLEGLDLRIILFVVFVLNFFSFWPSSNEEIYFALAKQSMDPDWVQGSFTLSEQHGSRFLFQWVIGGLAKFISIPNLVLFTRLISFGLFALVLAPLFKRFSIGNIAAIFSLQLFFLLDQSFFANEWIIGAVESKVFAYLFIFMAINKLLDEELRLTTLFAVLATYMHVLIGAWFIIALVLYLFWTRFETRRVFILIGSMAIALLPLFVYLLLGLRCEYSENPHNVNPSWIYSFFRNPHHLGITKDWLYFKDNHLLGALWTLAFFLISLKVLPQYLGEKAKKLNRLNILFSGIALFFIFVGIWDRQGLLLVYQPFRQVGLFTFFIVFLLVCLLLKQDEKFVHSLKQIFLILTIALLAFSTVKMVDRNMFIAKGKLIGPDRSAAYEAANNLSDPGDVFVVLGYGGDWDPELAFERMTQRPRYCIYKFTPINECRVLEWYDRVKWKERMGWNIEELFNAKKTYDIDFVFSNKAYEDDRLNEVFAQRGFWIYKL